MVQYANKIVSIHKEIIFIKIAKEAAYTTFTNRPRLNIQRSNPDLVCRQNPAEFNIIGHKTSSQAEVRRKYCDKAHEAMPGCESTYLQIRPGVGIVISCHQQRTTSPPFRMEFLCPSFA